MTLDNRLLIDVCLPPTHRREALIGDVRVGLTAARKWLPPIWFYDDEGSRLFEQITTLPEYYLTRAETSLLRSQAGVIAEQTNAEILVEMGAGTSQKTLILLDALTARGTLHLYSPLDVSDETLRLSAHALADRYPSLKIHAIVGDFHRHLDQMPNGGSRLVAFLGSTLGNLTREERGTFLRRLRSEMGDRDRVLLGLDLVKDPARLLAAYNDSSGVTAAFNRNVLVVMNRELGATFDPMAFDHVAEWNAEQAWMEMQLRSRVAQRVPVPGAGIEVSLQPGETIRTEISAKFTRQGIAAELAAAGWTGEQLWTAREEDFALVLARPAG